MVDTGFRFSAPSGPEGVSGWGEGAGVLRVLVVGSDPLALGGLAALLEDEPDLSIVAQTVVREGQSSAALSAARLHHPDAIVWDLGGGISSAGPLAEIAAGDAPVLALVSGEDMAAMALRAGARGAAFRDGTSDHIAVAIRALTEDLVVLDEGLAPALLGRRAVSADGFHPEQPTSRELEVVQLLAQGLSNKAIGARLGISEHTAKFHVNAILGKLDAQTRTDAVVRAARLGWVLI